MSGACAGTPRRATNARTGGGPSQETAGTNPSTGQAPLYFLTLSGSSVCALPSRVTCPLLPHRPGVLPYGRRPGQPSSTSLARMACVQRSTVEYGWHFVPGFLKYVDIQTWNFKSAPGSHRGTEGEIAMAALPRCTASSSYIRRCPFLSLYSYEKSMELPATTDGEWRRRCSLQSHKGGPDTFPSVEKGVFLRFLGVPTYTLGTLPWASPSRSDGRALRGHGHDSGLPWDGSSLTGGAVRERSVRIKGRMTKHPGHSVGEDSPSGQQPSD